MAGILAGKARKLELARGISRDRSKASAVSLVWTWCSAEIDRGSLADGELLVSDFTVTHLGGDQPAVAERRDRVTRDPEDYGRVYAYNGAEIGRVMRGPRGGRVLQFTWPDGLAASAG